LLTQRDCTTGSALFPAYGVWREAEDVLLDAIDADLVHLDLAIEAPRVRVRRKVGEVLRWAGGPQRSVPAFTGSQALRPLEGRYDAAIFLAFSIWDLQLVERLGPLRRYADRIAVWFFETWPSSYTDGKVLLEPFHAVDDIFVGLERSVEPLAATLGRPVTYMPMAIDTLRFCPDGPTSERQIDLIGIGRRREEQHEQMLAWSLDRERFYLYDSVELERPADNHRDNLGRWYATSKLATCNYAKSDRPDIVGDLRVLPGRLFEGLAAGAGLLGIPPDPESQRNLFGRTVVYPTPDDPRALPEFLEDLIHRHGPSEASANVRTALAGHDWVHRWIALFNHLELDVPDTFLDRVNRLQRQAEKFADPTGRFDVPVGPPPGGYVLPGMPANRPA
jgi:hypothetical protein